MDRSTAPSLLNSVSIDWYMYLHSAKCCENAMHISKPHQNYFTDYSAVHIFNPSPMWWHEFFSKYLVKQSSQSSHH